MLNFDDDAFSLRWIRRRIGGSTEDCGAHVPMQYAALLAYKLRTIFIERWIFKSSYRMH